MRIFNGCLFISLFFDFSCGGGGGGGNDVQQGDAELPQDVQVEAETVADVPEEEKFSLDVNTDIDFNTEAVIDIAAEKCHAYCNHFMECNPGVKLDFEVCKNECIDKVKKESEYLINIFCYTEEKCEKAQECLDKVAGIDPDCVTICLGYDFCGLIPSELAENLDECYAACSAMIMGDQAKKDLIMPCLKKGVEKCSIGELFVCMLSFDPNFCEENICAKLEKCGEIPGLFETKQKCLSDCNLYDGDQKIILSICLAAACEDGKGEIPPSKCYPPQSEPAKGVKEFCEVLVPLCKDQPDFPFDDLTLCAYAETGLGQYFGIDFEGKDKCLKDNFEKCPMNFEYLFEKCFIEIYPPCKEACEDLLPCVLALPPDQQMFKTLEECILGCSQAHQTDPEFEQVFNCVVNAEKCEDKLKCIQS